MGGRRPCLTDADVADAPAFEEIVVEVAAALSGCVVAGYNVSFDLCFLEMELAHCGVPFVVPYVCSMALRSVLGIGRRCSLDVACEEHGIERTASHLAAHDALDAARVLRASLLMAPARGFRTFGDLAVTRSHKFLESFGRAPLSQFCAPAGRRKSRHDAGARVGGDTRVRRYFAALASALSDMQLTDAEVQELVGLRHDIGITLDELRAVHGQLFAGSLFQFLSDVRIADEEKNYLHLVHHYLHRLGWAPGDV